MDEDGEKNVLNDLKPWLQILSMKSQKNFQVLISYVESSTIQAKSTAARITMANKEGVSQLTDSRR